MFSERNKFWTSWEVLIFEFRQSWQTRQSLLSLHTLHFCISCFRCIFCILYILRILCILCILCTSCILCIFCILCNLCLLCIFCILDNLGKKSFPPANIAFARAQLANIGQKKRTFLRGRFCFSYSKEYGTNWLSFWRSTKICRFAKPYAVVLVYGNEFFAKIMKMWLIFRGSLMSDASIISTWSSSLAKRSIWTLKLRLVFFSALLDVLLGAIFLAYF